jgi:DNA-binding transcriptional ArsR family regulator
MSDLPAELSGHVDVDSERLDAIFAVLAHRRRRYVVTLLWECDEAISLPDLADEIAVRENGNPISQISADYVKEVYLSLYHTHIPKLDDADIVEYVQEQDLVFTSAHTDLAHRIIDSSR